MDQRAAMLTAIGSAVAARFETASAIRTPGGDVGVRTLPEDYHALGEVVASAILSLGYVIGDPAAGVMLRKVDA